EQADVASDKTKSAEIVVVPPPKKPPQLVRVTLATEACDAVTFPWPMTVASETSIGDSSPTLISNSDASCAPPVSDSKVVSATETLPPCINPNDPKAADASPA